MKTVVKGAIRDEKGNVLILVLILLVVGGLILTPLLGLMSTGLLAGQVYERKMQEYYAADAGVEDALLRIKDGDIPSEPYFLRVNEKDVRVTIGSTDAQQFVIGLLDLNKTKTWGHSDWVTIGRIPEDGKAEITISWNGSGEESLTDVGIWLSGTYSYVEGQPIPNDDIRAQYPAWNFDQKPYGGGTAFIWTWENQPHRPKSKDTPTSTLTFEFTPNSKPGNSIAFTKANREDVGPSYDGEFNLYQVTATAISDTGTGTADITSHTTVVARAVRQSCPVVEIEVLNWNIS